MPVQVGDLSWGWGLGTTVTPYRRRDDTSFKYSKTSTDGNNEDTYRSKLGVLSFISVVVQSDEVKTRLHLVAASAKHVLTTLTLTRFWRATGKIHNVRKFRWSFLKIWRKIALEDIFNAVTNSQDSKPVRNGTHLFARLQLKPAFVTHVNTVFLLDDTD